MEPEPEPSSPQEPQESQELDVELILDGLNKVQRDAVVSDAEVLQILAPPGSGKTRTLTSRVAYMLANGMSPSNIIVATFTNKASKEMKERISKMIGGGLEHRLIIGTFHSIATKYLRKYGHLIGLPKEFGIADTGDSSNVISRIIKRNKYSTMDGSDAGNVRSRISTLKAKMQSVDDYIASQKKANSTDEFSKIYDQYEKELKNSNLLDFDDLLLRCLDLLRAHPLCVSNIESVLIDEFQDTNLVQFDLMCLFAQRRNKITIVGDPDQSIYGFRAAEIGNLKTMQQVYPNTIVLNLEENYRSAAAILNCSLEVIQQDKARPQKGITPTHQLGTSPVLRKLPSPHFEAQWIVQEILRLRALTGNMFTFDDIAILVRSAGLARDIEPQMNNQRIPYRLIAGTKFFERQEVKPVLDYLRVIIDPNNSEALARVVNIPKRRLGSKSVEGLVAEAHKRGISIWTLICKGVRGDLKFEAPISKLGEQSLCQFIKVIKDIRKLLESAELAMKHDIAPIIQSLLDKIGYRAHIENMQKPGEERWVHVEELIEQATEFCNNLAAGFDDDLPDSDADAVVIEESTISIALGRFLANAALATVKESPEAENSQASEGVLTISTIHNAKGLEWPIVFVPGCYTGSIPHSRSEDTDEERRLLYVAMTRAQVLLYLSYPSELRDRKSGDKQESNLCTFLAEDKLKPLMKSAGPKISLAVIEEFGKIMGRECPTIEKIQETTKAANLPNRDDYVPSDDPSVNNYGTYTENEFQEDYDDDFDDHEGYNSRNSYSRTTTTRNYNQSSTSAYNRSNSYSTNRTTMTTAFSAQSTTIQGFRSANSHMHSLVNSQLEAEVDVRRVAFKRKSDGISGDNNDTKQSQSKSVKQKTDSKSKPKPKNTLANYFQKAPVKETDALPETRTGTSAPEPATKGPTLTKPPKQEKYIYLSSSPERPPPRNEIINQNHHLQEQMRRNPPVSNFTSVSGMVNGSSYMAPTTMSRMAGNTANAGSSTSRPASAVPLKTLGMRRSMSGWNDRHGTKK
ncbi:hypothetical protein H072_7469 [Dactylellina haptotyla CBS 200.50]|uniref:DNA 3'-5' helicase n=1 Tax=Dactylellina haptotyla (strain CBS 200.50) TaxID=1284197 RepID=S8A7F1_DACHA|nr:hypothetical protein H072_7469 [Dactylellina haptotyla CBS 200.50]